METDRFNEEHANNLLLGALKFHNPHALLRPVWTELCRLNGRVTLADAIPLHAELWNQSAFHLQPVLIVPELKEVLRKTEDGIEADANLSLEGVSERYEFVIEGEFREEINCVQAFQQMAAWLWRSDCPPENLYWVLINAGMEPPDLDRPRRILPKVGKLLGLPPRTDMSPVEFITRFASQAMDILEKREEARSEEGRKRRERVRKLTDPGFVEERILWANWEWLAKQILVALEGAGFPANPRVLEEIIKDGLAADRFRYRKPTPLIRRLSKEEKAKTEKMAKPYLKRRGSSPE